MERKCVCCGGENLITGVKFIDKSDNYTEENAQVSIDRDPSAWVYKGTVRANVHGEVCDDCGHLQLFVLKRSELRAVHEMKQQNTPLAKSQLGYIICKNCNKSHRQEDCPNCGY